VRYRSELDNIATPAGVFARRAGIFRIATPFQRREFFRWPADQAVVSWQSAVLSAHHHGLHESLSDRLPSAVWL